ncbi:MAG: hypothetical protein ACI4OB_04940 [Christensenellales bacterium]
MNAERAKEYAAWLVCFDFIGADSDPCVKQTERSRQAACNSKNADGNTMNME